jgi:hypothetical protein
MIKTPINDNMTTRIIPGITNEHRIVSLPYWAWFWLDDYMHRNRISYQGILDTFRPETENDLTFTLRQIAELHHEHAMREVYNLANDNNLEQSQIINLLDRKKTKNLTGKRDLKLPRIYKLFGFMSCATTLQAVWERRNYEDSNKIN